MCPPLWTFGVGTITWCLNEITRAKSAFITPLGKFDFLCCPFGLAQAPAYFQKLINEVLRGLDFSFGYMDDIMAHADGVDTHV